MVSKVLPLTSSQAFRQELQQAWSSGQRSWTPACAHFPSTHTLFLREGGGAYLASESGKPSISWDHFCLPEVADLSFLPSPGWRGAFDIEKEHLLG